MIFSQFSMSHDSYNKNTVRSGLLFQNSPRGHGVGSTSTNWFLERLECIVYFIKSEIKVRSHWHPDCYVSQNVWYTYKRVLICMCNSVSGNVL